MRFAFLFLIFVSACAKFEVKAPTHESDIFRVAWAKNLDPSFETGNLPIGLGAPRIFDDIVYMGSVSGFMTAYDLESGRVLWTENDKTPLGAPVVYFNDHVAYGGLNGRFFVRNAVSGKLKYAIDLSAPIESAPFYHEGHIIIYLRGHQIVHLDAETGKVLWAYKRAVPVVTTLQRTTRPLIIGNKVVVGFADGFVGALSLEEGLLIWETKIIDQGKFVDIDLNPVLLGGMIITGSPSGELKAVNPDNGALARTFNVSVMAHPFVKGEQLILGTNDGEVMIMAADGEILKRIKISTQPVSAVTWWRDTLVAASFDGHLTAIDPLTMKVTKKFALGYSYSSIFSDLVVDKDYLAVYSSRNRLYLFH
jgi:outer membrane protein assembly factor BamB